jgi:hypothetical protein
MKWYNPISWFASPLPRVMPSDQAKGILGWANDMAGEIIKAKQIEANEIREASRLRLSEGRRPPHTKEEWLPLFMDLNPKPTKRVFGGIDPDKYDMWVESEWQRRYADEWAYWDVYDREAARVKEQFGMDYEEYLKRAEEGHNIVNDKKKWQRGWR